MLEAPQQPPGRRVQWVNDKQQQIFAAASALFNSRGFEAVTVSDIAETADVAPGTLFRYASSKAELLLMVYNHQFRQAIETGLHNAAGIADPAAAVCAMLAPAIEEAVRHPDNAAAYQNQLLFGGSTERYRFEGLAHVRSLEDAVAVRLMRCYPTLPDAHPELRANAESAARSVFAALHLQVAQPFADPPLGARSIDQLYRQITQIVLGFLTATAPTRMSW